MNDGELDLKLRNIKKYNRKCVGDNIRLKMMFVYLFVQYSQSHLLVSFVTKVKTRIFILFCFNSLAVI